MAASPQPKPPESPQRRVLRFEAAGILIIAALILIFTIARHWNSIPWGAR